MNETLAARTLALVQVYAKGRSLAKALRRAMVASRCERQAEDPGRSRCYLLGGDRLLQCGPCKARGELWDAFARQLRENRGLLRRLELLGLRLSQPDPVPPPEPKPLLDLMGGD